MKNSGMVFVFEGIDSSGKSTLCEKLRVQLSSEGYSVKVFHFPGKNTDSLGGMVYKIHHGQISFPEKLPPLSIQTLHVAAHVDSWMNFINPAVKEGTIVLLDRFWWSTYAYGRLQSISPRVLTHLIEVEKSCYSPDIIHHYFYIFRPSSGDFNPPLHHFYLQLTKKSDFENKTTVIKSDFAKDNAYTSVLEIIHAEIGK